MEQIKKYHRFFEKNWNKFIKKDEKISEFGSKLEVNLKQIWKEFEENCKKEKTDLQVSSRTGKTITNLKSISSTIVTRVLVIFW